MKSIANMPGIGGSLGMCALCGGSFVAEVLLGREVQVIGVKGFDMDMCVHDKCADVLKQNGSDWRTLPDGPLRQAFENASQQQAEDQR